MRGATSRSCSHGNHGSERVALCLQRQRALSVNLVLTERAEPVKVPETEWPVAEPSWTYEGLQAELREFERPLKSGWAEAEFG
jgi:hypothetical protein